MITRTLPAAGLLLAAASAGAQTPDVFHALEWIEVTAGTHEPVPNPNGVLEPGEAVRLSLSVSFPPNGTLVAYQFPAPGGVAPIAGLQASGFDVIATGADGGQWSDFVVHHGFTMSPWVPLPNGSLIFGAIGQPLPPLGSLPISTNPLPNIWEAIWTPSSFAPRQAQFAIEPQIPIPGPGPYPPHVFVLRGTDPVGNPLFGIADGLGHYDSAQIPIVPAPGGLGLGLSALLLATRRWRR